MSTFEEVRKRLNGCRPFAWYLRRFKAIYEDGGIIPPEIFMIREERSGHCLRFNGRAGTSGSGHESVKLAPCDESNDRFFWHLGNVNRKTGKCCSGLRAWNTEQCFQGSSGTGICEVSGRNDMQTWVLDQDGMLRHKDTCVGPGDSPGTLKQLPCIAFRNAGRTRFAKASVRIPLETKLYQDAQREHPEVFAKLNADLAAMESKTGKGPSACSKTPGGCLALVIADGTGRCLDETAGLSRERSGCEPFIIEGTHVKRAEANECLDTWQDNSAETWGFYACHTGDNQKFQKEGASRVCTMSMPEVCFSLQPWPVS